MGKGRDNHNYKHGLFAGWNDYRSGTPAKPISLAGQTTVLGRARRDTAVSRAVELLRDWRSNRWENEAAVRYGFRIALVCEGNDWSRADSEAADIVRLAFNRLGRGKETRPSEEEGQRYHVDPRENCRWCSGLIDEADMSGNRNRMFCRDEHARLAYQQWGMKNALQGSEMQREAYRAMYRERHKTRHCQTCRKAFKPSSDAADTRFCSIPCAAEARRRHIPPRPCVQCGHDFQPTISKPDSRFCSRQCQGASRQIHMPKPCAICETVFTPRVAEVECCSKACAAKKAAAARIDIRCECCGDTFEGRPGGKFCGPACFRVAYRVETGRTKKVSPMAFDYLLLRGGARITEERREAA